MKEDVLEQIVDDYFMHKGYFTRHNVRFKPDKGHVDFVPAQDSVHSDIDVIAFNPRGVGADRVAVVSCKSWQGGFNPHSAVAGIANKKKAGGREAWKSFRELCEPKWSEAFLQTVEDATGSRAFTYFTVVTKLNNEASRSEWENSDLFHRALGGNPIRILTLSNMLDELWPSLSHTPAASEIGRAIQLMKAARWTPATP